MTIKAKILSLVAAFALMVLAISALGVMTMRHYDRVIAEYSRASDNAFRGERLNLLLSQTTIDIRNIYMAKTPEVLAQRISSITAHTNAINTLLTDWKKRLRPGEVPQFAAVEKDTHSMVMFGTKVAEIARTQSPAAAEIFGASDAAISWREAFQSRIDTMVVSIQDNLKVREAEMEAYKKQRVSDYVLIVGSGTLLLLLASLWVAIRSIANPLKKITSSIINLSEGAYDTAIPAASGQDEISRLWTALGILKSHAIEAKRLNDEKLELHLD